MIKHWIYEPCPRPDETTRQAALARQAILTKPAGSLGRLENIATDFAAWQTREIPALDKICVRIFAADHGVCAQGVSAFPQAVTAQMIENFINGGAAISVLSSALNANFAVVNMGTVQPIERSSELLIDSSIAPGTLDFTTTEAMTEAQLQQALEAGKNSLEPCDLFIGGEMGIGNTTSASALYAALLSLSAKDTVGPGTGLDDTRVNHKANIVDQALAKHAKALTDPVQALRCLGGFEIAALVGVYIAAAQQKTPVLVDGFICTAAALLAVTINPSVRAWFMFAHQSAEPAHQKALSNLEATPLLDLQMRLGEGSGAALAATIIQQALSLHANMATFDAAGVDEKVNQER